MRVALLSDAARPQVNGVVTTIDYTCRELTAMGHEVALVTPEGVPTVGLPTYPEIRLAVRPFSKVREVLDSFEPEAIHIATEGPVGLAGRRYCRRRGLPFTTSFHTRFPEYVQLRATWVPLSWGYGFLRWFHQPAARTLVTNDSLIEDLRGHGLQDLVLWPRGVDTELFRPLGGKQAGEPGWAPRPRFIYVGRVSVEKNLEAFLGLDLPGSKIVVGDGPALPALQARYPEVYFAGRRVGEALVRYMAGGDVFVFPSRTDTLGLVLFEALACGLPIAAYPEPGPRNVVRPGVTGFLDEDLEAAATQALDLDRADCRRQALRYSWREATEAFAGNLEPVRSQPASREPASIRSPKPAS